jgi:hypothetical protein
MNSTDLRPAIRACVDEGTRPVTAGEIRTRAARSARPVPRRVPGRLAVTATAVAAAGVAAGLVASQVGGTAPVRAGRTAPAQAGRAGHAATRTVLTAAMVKHVASASRAAMTSGTADIDWTSSGLPSVVQDITFDGANWNDVSNPGQPVRVHHVVLKVRGHTVHAISWTGESINRVVDGQTYYWPAIVTTPKGPEVTSRWQRLPGTGGGGLDIPDPRTLLSVLSPSAGFATAGTSTVNGVTVTSMLAATPGAVPITPLNDIIQSEPDNAKISAIDLWVDSSDVVQKAQITVTGTNGKGTPQSATVTVTFSQIGQLQPITAPSSYITFGKH